MYSNNPEDTLQKISMYNASVLVLSNEIDDGFLAMTGGNPISILCPPYSAYNANSVLEFDMEYENHLYGYDQQQILAIIFRALQLGKNIIIFQPFEEAKMKYHKTLFSFMYHNYGVNVEAPNNPAMFNNLLNLLGEFNLISSQEYIAMYDINSLNILPPTRYIIDKIIREQNLDPYTDVMQYIINCKTYNHGNIIDTPVRIER